jgi:glycosyltransferase involved in cell wall biosynthesis
MASHHQAEMLRGLAKLGVDVRWHVTHLISPRRAKVGWAVPDTTGVTVVETEGVSADELIQAAGPNALHVFSPRGTPAGMYLAWLTALGRIRGAFFCEKPNGRGIRLVSASLFYLLLARFVLRAEFFLALGDSGAEFYRRLGFRNVFPIWYTVRPSNAAIPAAVDGVPYRIIVVSRLVRLKRVDVILNAAARCGLERWHLDIFGDGPKRAELESVSRKLGLETQVTFHGATPSSEVRTAIAAADTLVLASEWEGWGAVVNESIAEGARLIVSNACGAACLAHLSPHAEVFVANDIDALASAIRKQGGMGRVSNSERESRRALHRKIDGSASARYLASVFLGDDPLPPWRAASP